MENRSGSKNTGVGSPKSEDMKNAEPGTAAARQDVPFGRVGSGSRQNFEN